MGRSVLKCIFNWQVSLGEQFSSLLSISNALQVIVMLMAKNYRLKLDDCDCDPDRDPDPGPDYNQTLIPDP